MNDALAATAVLLLHLAFVLFVVFGALLVARRPVLAWLHLPAAAWGFFVEFSGRGCPLTAWENLLRVRAGLAGYEGGFIEHHVLRLLYPAGLTRELQLALAAAVVIVNLLLYGWVFLRSRARSGRRP
ncbi:DUF2784 domain-containing protein [Massilia sp.]|uniref:DUF2784 domain-containing protein n=1 Tax=Massilia sp. TaxID=1882437 RepID=UPI0028A287D9|nr:DUF2784 domain-containing protein [Massilia sp.]